jgi:DNA-directed RNA polymerase subunit RPC12/RpoP
MPQLVICHKCGTTLYEGENLKPSDEIIQEYDGRCPSCNKRLSYVPKTIEVKPFDFPDRWNPFEPQKEIPSRTENETRPKKRARKRSGYVSPKPRSGGIWETE